MKFKICTITGIWGSALAACLGGWDTSLQTLSLFMAVDFIMGLTVAGVFKKSPKTTGGALESRAGFKGLCRKGECLLIVLVAAQLDKVIGAAYIRDMVCIAFITNELISIVENAGLMGIEMPPVITKAIEVLQNKSSMDTQQNDKE